MKEIKSINIIFKDIKALKKKKNVILMPVGFTRFYE
jgi:hypothetical protein